MSRLVGAVALGGRSGARARVCFLLLSLCVVHVRTLVDVHLDSCDRSQAVSFKTVVSIATSSTYKHKQWQLAQSSSSTWWNWQGSWWCSYTSESQGGGEPSLENELGDPLLLVFWREPSKMAFTNSVHFCYRWIVYS